MRSQTIRQRALPGRGTGQSKVFILRNPKRSFIHHFLSGFQEGAPSRAPARTLSALNTDDATPHRSFDGRF